MEFNNLHRLTTLGHAGRMSVFRLLVRRFPDAVPAGEIAEVLDLKASTLSVYLSALMQVGMIAQHRQGTSLRYRVRMDAMDELSRFLLLDCCRGRPELCSAPSRDQRQGPEGLPRRKFNVLFICTGNSARSIFAEAILRKEAGGRFNAYSAGTAPRSEINPLVLEMLKAKGYDTAPLRAKNLDEFRREGAPHPDFVITVCDHAANEGCPAWAGQPITAHWGTPDPVNATGTDAERRLAFQHAFGALRNRIVAFAALPLETLDRVAAQAAVDEIGTSETLQ